MRVRIIELRILAAALVGLWLFAFALIQLGYRPGGPVDILVGLAAAPPTLIAMAALLWPPVARGGHAFAAIAWVGVTAVLLLIPALGAIFVQIRGRGPQTLLPSVEAAYPWLLALIATSVFAGLGIARRRLGETALRRRRLALGTAIGLALTVAAGTVFGAAAIGNEVALRDRVVPDSRFGPTDPSVEPPRCTDPLTAGASAVVSGRLELDTDGTTRGTLTLDGTRVGENFRWIGFAASPVTIGQHGSAHIADSAWSRAPGTGWVPVPQPHVAGDDLDLQVMRTALAPDNRQVAEERALAFIEGARARHCRVALNGTTFRLAFPEVRLLVGGADLSVLVGELDYWVFADGQLGRVEARVNGSAAGIVEGALTTTLRAQLTATDRGVAHDIARPSR